MKNLEIIARIGLIVINIYFIFKIFPNEWTKQ
jgi:hypothetical protein